MIVDRIIHSLFRMQENGSIPVKIVAEVINQFEKFSAFAGLIDEVMKFGIELHELLIISLLKGIFPGGTPFDESIQWIKEHIKTR